MKNKILILLLFSAFASNAQKLISLYPDKAPGSENWNWDEKEMVSKLFQTRVIYNVSKPTLTVYTPSKELNNGTAVVICPGGGFHTLSIDREGIEVAKWLNTKGINAFILKYRLVKSETNDPVKELLSSMDNREKFDAANALVIPLAISDGLTAMKYVRANADKYNIKKDKVGIIGFSAGGTVACGVTYTNDEESMPNFLASIYAYTTPLQDKAVPTIASPIFIAVASDDRLGLVPHSLKLYNDWITAGKSAELHIYSKGDHGFGMGKKGLPVDSWIERFGDWLNVQGYLKK